MFSINSTLFCAKILAQLAICYNAKAQEIGLSPEWELNQEIYSEALTETLRAFCAEDARKYGRMLGLRHILSKLMQKGTLTVEQLTCMYAKDIAIVRQLDVEDDQVIASIIENPPTKPEID